MVCFEPLHEDKRNDLIFSMATMKAAPMCIEKTKSPPVLDILPYFMNARENIATWNSEAMERVIEILLNAFTGSHLEWDKHDGERWAFIRSESEEYLVMIQCDIPLTVSMVKLGEETKGILENMRVTILPTPGWSEPSFSVNLDEMLIQFPDFGTILRYVDDDEESWAAKFSAWDLFYSTHHSILSR